MGLMLCSTQTHTQQKVCLVFATQRVLAENSSLWRNTKFQFRVQVENTTFPLSSVGGLDFVFNFSLFYTCTSKFQSNSFSEFEMTRIPFVLISRFFAFRIHFDAQKTEGDVCWNSNKTSNALSDKHSPQCAVQFPTGFIESRSADLCVLSAS